VTVASIQDRRSTAANFRVSRRLNQNQNSLSVYPVCIYTSRESRPPVEHVWAGGRWGCGPRGSRPARGCPSVHWQRSI